LETLIIVDKDKEINTSLNVNTITDIKSSQEKEKTNDQLETTIYTQDPLIEIQKQDPLIEIQKQDPFIEIQKQEENQIEENSSIIEQKETKSDNDHPEQLVQSKSTKKSQKRLNPIDHQNLPSLDKLPPLRSNKKAIINLDEDLDFTSN